MTTQTIPDTPRHFLQGIDARGEGFDLWEAVEALDLLRKQVVAMSRTPESSTSGLVGLETLVRRMIQAVVLGEHCLIEGFPGLAKTQAAKSLAAMLGLSFQRIQFVPDLMPSDLIHRERLNLDKDGRAAIEWRPGPIFTNVLLADEINRASPKAQAALLEVTEERQVTPMYRPRMIARPPEEAEILLNHGPYFDHETIEYDSHEGQAFVVLATMNPIEQEGVYPLSEAQLDRFAFHVVLDYPDYADLDRIGRHAFGDPAATVPPHRPEDHARTLYFLARVRRLILGPSARNRWFCPGNSLLRAQVSDLIELTHARPRADGSAAARGVALPKHERVARLLDDRKKDPNRAMQAYATNLSDKIEGDTYPEVITGASPRGLLKLIRAAHAEALMNGKVSPDDANLLAPTWSDVAAVAPDILRHRIRLNPSSVAMGMRSDAVIEELMPCIQTRRT